MSEADSPLVLKRKCAAALETVGYLYELCNTLKYFVIPMQLEKAAWVWVRLFILIMMYNNMQEHVPQREEVNVLH